MAKQKTVEETTAEAGCLKQAATLVLLINLERCF
jgi:hypothetical protein